jgi:hypothetical protein
VEAIVEEAPVEKVVGYGGRELAEVLEEEDGATNVEEVSTSALFKVVGTTAAVVEASGIEVASCGVTVTTTVSERWFVIVVVYKAVLGVARSELTAGAEVTTEASELVAAAEVAATDDAATDDGATEDATAEDGLGLQGFDGFPVGRAKPDEAPVPDGKVGSDPLKARTW